MARLGIVHHPLFQEHYPGPYHPESPRRLAFIEDVLSGPAQGQFVEVEPRPASPEEIRWVHTPAYFDRVAATAGQEEALLDLDTRTSARSFEAALLAAGGLIRLVEACFAGAIEAGFGLVRPPGHHAEANRGMGFCLFNNVAVAAEYALRQLGLERVLIVDWDVHHGNATQHSFEEEDRVLYFSTHQYPFYPGTGAAEEVGRGRGLGRTVNVPLGYGHGDEEYIQIFSRILIPVAEEFRPQVVLVSAGFDILESDPLGSQAVSPQGFAGLARIVQEIAERHCPGKLILTLEGGYDVRGQAAAVQAIIAHLSGARPLPPGKLRDDQSRPDIPAVTEVKLVQRRYWQSFKEK